MDRSAIITIAAVVVIIAGIIFILNAT